MPPPQPSQNPFTPLVSAFTLVELLAVIAVVSVLLAIVVPALPEMLSGSSSNRAADLLIGSATQARQLAVNRRAPVAMVVTRPDPEDPTVPQAVMLMESIPPASGTSAYEWKPAGPWTSAPEQARIDVLERDDDASFFPGGTYANLPTTLPLNYRNAVVNRYDFILFHPNGTVESARPGPALAIRPIRRATAAECTVIVSNEVGFPRTIRH